jgi:uncharacterized protein Yka (UPF0111/DUF47 family)
MTKVETVVNERSDKSPFIQTADYAANKVGHHATVLTGNLQKECMSIYEEVFNSFGSIFEAAEDNNGDVAAVKTTLHNYLPSVSVEMNEIVDKLKAIEKNPHIKTEPNTASLGSAKVKVKKEEKQQHKVFKIKLRPAAVKREA